MPGYFPPLPGGGSGLTLPVGNGSDPSDLHGLSGGTVGIEFNGAATPLVSDTPLVFDTVYSDFTSSASGPLTGPVDTDEFTFAPAGITIKNTGMYLLSFSVSFSGPLSAAETFQLGGSGAFVGAQPYIPLHAGALGFQPIPTVLLLVGGEVLTVNFSGVDGAETAELSYANLGVRRLA